jgi:hypothetical protein
MTIQEIQAPKCDYYNLLAEQYAQRNPPPEDRKNMIRKVRYFTAAEKKHSK